MVPNYEYIRQLYVEKLSGVISETDEAQLELWLATDDKARQIWQLLEEDRKCLDVDRFRQNIHLEEAFAQVKQQLESTSTKRVRLYSRYAAVIALFLVAGITIYWINGNTPLVTSTKKTPVTFPATTVDNPHVQLITSEGQAINLGEQSSRGTISLPGMEIRTGAEELQAIYAEKMVMSTLVVPQQAFYKIVLPDSSKVWLNAMSKLHFPSRFTDSIREVSLEGEGYFEVTPDKKRPFIVRIGQTNVHVLGTRFNLNGYNPKMVETALVEGSVLLLAENGQRVQLQPGYAATYNGERFLRTAFDAVEALAWMDGVYHFHNASLDDLALVINRWYGLSVTLADTALIRHRITGLMERRNIAYFLADLNASTGISHRIEGDTLFLY